MVSSLIQKAKKIASEPKVVKGNHLTVTTHPDGRVELEWDWDALVQEVREACASVGNKPAKKKAAPKKATAVVEAKPKAKTKTKNVEEPKVVEKPKTKRKTKEKK
jgi:hypothetical protein